MLRRSTEKDLPYNSIDSYNKSALPLWKGLFNGAAMDTKFLKEKKIWFASLLVAWAAALQAHIMWIQKQDSFKEKFGDLNEKDGEAGTV